MMTLQGLWRALLAMGRVEKLASPCYTATNLARRVFVLRRVSRPVVYHTGRVIPV
jgi:hypothetical protein